MINLSVSFPGQYHLQIEKAQLEDDAPYECQAGQSESSEAIISSAAWVNVLSELNHAASGGGMLGTHKHVLKDVCNGGGGAVSTDNSRSLLTINQHIKSS